MIWNDIGFEKDIFFIEALEPNKDEMELYVGKTKIIERFLVDCLSGERSLKIVTGQLGVGKTTFVNACQYYSYIGLIPGSKLRPDRVLICYPKIQIQENDNIETVIQKIISSVCHSIVKYSKKENHGEVQDLIKYFTSLTQTTGSTQFGVNASFGVGGGVNYSAPGKQYKDPIAWRPKFEILIDHIRSKLNYKGVFVVINNLEIATKNKLVEILDPLRDLVFDIKGLYSVLIGYSGITSTIISEIPRLKDYLSGTEHTVAPMDFETIKMVIKRRVDKYRISSDVNCFINDDSLSLFHFMSLQEARTTMKICSEVTKRAFINYPGIKNLSYEQSIDCFIEYCNDEARQIDLTPNNKRILEAIFVSRMVRPKDFGEFGYSTNAGFHSALKSLTKKGLLQIKSGGGNAKYYLPTGMTMLAGLTGALGDEIEKITQDLIRQKDATQKAITGSKKLEDPSQYYLFTEEELSDD